MKQEVYHPTWLFLSKLLSGLLHPLWLLFSHTKYFSVLDKSKIKKIIIGEYHCIGDVVLIIPALKVLKKSFPDAELTLITNPDIRELAEEMNIAHEISPSRHPGLGVKENGNYGKMPALWLYIFNRNPMILESILRVISEICIFCGRLNPPSGPGLLPLGVSFFSPTRLIFLFNSIRATVPYPF